MDVYEKLKELGITLTPPSKPFASFLPAKELIRKCRLLRMTILFVDYYRSRIYLFG